nr:divergent polysaccharide deacetylase family protein [Roseospira visakhapatnamensis]
MPGKSRGGRKRVVDPLGDPLEDLGPGPPPMDGGADPGGAAVGIDAAGFPETLEPPTGIVSRLFGAQGGLDPRRGDRDLDLDDDEAGGPRAGLSRVAMMAGLGLLVLGGGAAAGWWMWQGQDQDASDTPVAGLEAPDAGTAPVPGDDGVQASVPVLVTPERVVMTIPPLTPPRDDVPSLSLDTPAVVADATAATDRSVQRRPWLTAPQDGDDGASSAETPAPETPDAETPDPETPDPETPDPETMDIEAMDGEATGMTPADASTDAGDQDTGDPATTDPVPAVADHGDQGHQEPTPGEPTPGDPAAHAESGTGEATDPVAPETIPTLSPGPVPGMAPDVTAETPTDHGTMIPDSGSDGGSHGDAPVAADGVRQRVDLAAPVIDLPDVPGLLPVPPGLGPLTEPEAPNRLGGVPPVPSYQTLAMIDGPRAPPLRAAPVPALQEAGAHGSVPTIGPDGTVPWRAYAAPDPAPPDSPRVAIVVRGLGMMVDPLHAAVTKLPPEVTLAFTPYARDARDKMTVARESGHEVMLELPMEPGSFPARDPGPLGLLTLLPDADNRDRLDQVLAAGHGYVGVMAGNGGRFAVSPDHMEPVLKRLRRAGLLYLHQGEARSLVANRRLLPPLTAVDVVVDANGFAGSVRARLDYLGRLARARGTAVGIMQATPLNFAALRDWVAGLEGTGVALSPLSAVVMRSGGGGMAAGMAGDPAVPGDGTGTPPAAGDDDPIQAEEGHG